MAEVKVFDSTLQNFASSLYKSEPKLQFPEKNWIVNGVLKLLGLSKGPVEVELTDIPTVSISQRGGVSADIIAGVTSVAKRHKPALPVTCHVDMKFDIRGKHLILLHQNVKCEIKGNKRKFVKSIVNLFLKIFKEHVESKIEQFVEGLQLPLPEGLDVAQIDFHDGFLVLRAVLPQENMQQLVDQLMKKMNVFRT